MALRSSDLCTLDDVKTRLGITGSSLDTLVEDAIKCASDLCAAYCDRVFEYDDEITEVLPGFGTLELILTRPPILSIESVSFDGAELDSDTYECLGEHLNSGIVVLTNGATWTAGIDDGGVGHNAVVGHERLRYSVVYAGGWQTPNQSSVTGSPAALPPAVRQAAIRAAVYYYQSNGQDMTLQSESLQSYSYSRGKAMDQLGDSGLPQACEAMLNRYRFVSQA